MDKQKKSSPLREIADQANAKKKSDRLNQAKVQAKAVFEHCQKEAAKGFYEAVWTQGMLLETKELLQTADYGIDVRDNGDSVSSNYKLTW